jgi:hypothetical protein
MANYRIATLLAEEAITAAGTKTIDINMVEPISRIELKFDILKATNVMSAHPAADVTKIELVDGSDVLFSLSGYECQALNIYDRKCGSMVEGCHINANDEISHYGIDFGRWLYDTMLALDTKRFTNLQLKITYTLTSCDGSASSGTIEVRAWVFDEKKITPSGFLMSKELYAYTCAAENSYKYIDFPLDFPIRKLLIRAYRAGYQPCDNIKEFVIDEDTGTKTIMDFATEAYFSFQMTSDLATPVFEQFQGYSLTTANYKYVTPTWYWTTINVTGESASDLSITVGGGGGKIDLRGAGSVQCNGFVHGYLPLHCFEIPFGDPNEIVDWYDTSKRSQVRLRLKAGSSGTSGTAQVVLQQYRKY